MSSTAPIHPHSDISSEGPSLLFNTVEYFIIVKWTNHDLSPGQLWFDTGCARGLGGMKQHLDLEQVYMKYNLQCVTDRSSDDVHFGG